MPSPERAAPAAERAHQQVFLMPGQWYFGSDADSVRTLLGSCVRITVWHPRHRFGGMCHYLLPRRARPAPGQQDARYGEEAVALLLDSLRRCGTQPGEYECHLYGGADTFGDAAGVNLDIGTRNIEAGWALIDQAGFQLVGVDVGDHVPRTVTLEISTGAVHMARGQRART